MELENPFQIGESVLVDESRSTRANSLTDSRNSPTLRMKMVSEASIRAPPQGTPLGLQIVAFLVVENTTVSN